MAYNKQMKHLLVVVSLLFLSTISAQAIAFPVYNASHIADNADLLTPQQESRLRSQLESFETNTSYALALATVKSLQGLSEKTYAQELLERWQEAGRVDLLLLVAPVERKVRLQADSNIRALLSHQDFQAVIDNDILPAFKRGDYAGGIMNGMRMCMRKIRMAQAVAPLDEEIRGVFADALKTLLKVVLTALILIVIVFRFLPTESYFIKSATAAAVFGVVVFFFFGELKSAMSVFAVIFLVMFFGTNYYFNDTYFGGGGGGGDSGGASGDW